MDNVPKRSRTNDGLWNWKTDSWILSNLLTKIKEQKIPHELL